MACVTDQAFSSAIVSFHRDELGDWFARLACGHHQHTRHQPPWINRPWIESEAGRRSMIGVKLDCKKCAQGLPADDVPPKESLIESETPCGAGMRHHFQARK